MPQLTVSVEGVEIRHVPLRKDRTTLGRHPDNDVVFDNLVVSSRHCVFERQGVSDVFIEDLQSTNGTCVNGKMIRRERLRDGDVIAIGNFRIAYSAASAQPSGFGSTTAWRVDAELVAPKTASFQVVNGSSAGLEMPVVKAVTTFGKPGVSVISVSHRRDGYYVAFLDGTLQPTLNGGLLGVEAVQLANNDVLELDGTRMLFRLSS